jgi:radical SAM protein with 4Fe4S-binding SPASM domain
MAVTNENYRAQRNFPQGDLRTMMLFCLNSFAKIGMLYLSCRKLKKSLIKNLSFDLNTMTNLNMEGIDLRRLSALVRRHFRTLIPFLTVRKTCNAMICLVEMMIAATRCRSRPFIYRVDPCTLCNLKCACCSLRGFVTSEKRVMELDDFMHIIRAVERHALRVSLYDEGEPLMNKDLYKMIAYATGKKVSTLVSSSFNVFRKVDVEPLFESGLSVLEPCLDGFQQNTYEQYRKGGDVDVVKAGIREVASFKRRHKKKWPFIDVQIILFDHLSREIPLLVQFLKECNVDRITFRKELLGYSAADDRVLPSRMLEPPRARRCYWLYLGMMVRPDGNVYPCGGRGFNRFPYGNILKQDLSEIWNNRYYTFSRALFSPGPALTLNKDLENVPCLSCGWFTKSRTVINS